VPFTDGAKAEEKTPAAGGRSGLVGMPDNARIEERGRLEGIFVQKICADEALLQQRKFAMNGQGIFHLSRAIFKRREKVVMTAVEVIENVGEHDFSRFNTQAQDAVDDMVRPRLIGWVEISRLDARLEGTHDNPCRVRAKVERLAIQKR
jgi:hypothetical protein